VAWALAEVTWKRWLAWPDQRSLEIMRSFPHMYELRAAVLLSAIGDVKAFPK